MQRRRSIPNGIPRSVYDAKLGHFTLLFCRVRHWNVQRFKSTLLFCSLNLLFGDVLVAVVVVVCLRSLISPIDWMNISLHFNEVLVHEKAGKFVRRCSLFELNGRRVEIKRARQSFHRKYSLLNLFYILENCDQRAKAYRKIRGNKVCWKFSALCESNEARLHLFS